MTQREKTEQLRKTTLDLAAAIVDPSIGDNTFDSYMDWISRFHNYSFGNIGLILSQRPEASHVAGYQTWKRLGRYVKGGEKGIAILIPMKSKPVIDVDPQTEEQHVQPGHIFFGVGHVFDAAQTAGEGEIPNYKTDLEEARPLLLASTMFAEQLGIAVHLRPLFGSTNGFSEIGRIVLNSNRSEGVMAQTAAHEIAHEILHAKHERLNLPSSFLEGEAEATAVVVMRSFGFDTVSNGAAYIRSHGAKASSILSSLDRITTTARTIIEGISIHLNATENSNTQSQEAKAAACQA